MTTLLMIMAKIGAIEIGCFIFATIAVALKEIYKAKKRKKERDIRRKDMIDIFEKNEIKKLE